MSIEINYGSGSLVGPGFIVTLRTDLPGPWPSDTHWNIQLVATPEDLSGYTLFDVETPNPNIGLAGTLGFYGGSSHVVVGNDKIFHGATNALKVRLIADGVTADEVTIPVQTDLVTGTQALVVAEVGAGTGSGNFTEEDRVVLMQTNANTYRDWGGGITSPLNLILRMPPLQSLQRWQITPDRTGEGDLNPADPLPSFIPHALEIEIVSHPEGIGVDEGAPPALEIEYVQLAANTRLQDSHFTITDRLAERAGRVMWQPQPWEPSVIHYWIVPGVTVRFWWVGLRIF